MILLYVVKDAACVWWTKVKDSKADVRHRAEELLLTIKYCREDSIIITGHSLFWRNLMRTYICPDYSTAEPEHCTAVTTKKLPNCGVAKCAFDFSSAEPGGKPTAVIRNIRLMFGTEVPMEHSKEGDREQDDSGAGGDE
jgi:hypothetical protein